MKRKKVLMACSNPWNSVFQVGSHHLAHQLLHMGYEVAFISDPISPLHLARGKELKKRLQLYAQPSSKQEPLWAYVPGALFTPHNAPLLRSRWLYKHWHQLTFPSLINLAEHPLFSKKRVSRSRPKCRLSTYPSRVLTARTRADSKGRCRSFLCKNPL